MMRSHFDEQLQRLNEEMIQMGGLIECAIEDACRVMLSRDREAARAVVKKRFPNHCVLAGVPAKVVRKGITWDERDVLPA